MSRLGSRIALFLALCAGGAAALAAYVQFRPGARPAESATLAPEQVTANPAALVAFSRKAHAVFVNASLDDYNDRLAVVPLDDAGPGPRFVGELRCERVHFGGRVGLCLNADRGVLTRYYGYLFDESFHARAEFPLQGTPSRARVSPDGTLAAFTVFVAGDSYTNHSFSTRTSILDTGSGQIVGELEQFAAQKDGEPFHAQDFNYWGVTFAREPGVFYATLATGGHLYLVRGSVPRREVSVVVDGVECPSLSPDDTRVVFKKRETVNGRFGWRLSVLDLRTLAAVPVAETRSVDDQAEWLDNTHVLYTPSESPPGIWVMAVDGSSPPQRLLDHAVSPSVLR